MKIVFHQHGVVSEKECTDVPRIGERVFIPCAGVGGINGTVVGVQWTVHDTEDFGALVFVAGP